MIKTKRKFLSLNQVEVASAIDISYRHYQNIEAGKVNIRLDTLIKLSNFLDIKLIIENNEIKQPMDNDTSQFDLVRINELTTQLGIAFTIIDHKYNYHFINDYMAQLNGMTANDHIGKNFSDICPSTLENIKEYIDLCASKKEAIYFNSKSNISKDSHTTTFRSATIPLAEEKICLISIDNSIQAELHKHFEKLNVFFNKGLSIPTAELPMKNQSKAITLENLNKIYTFIKDENCSQ